MIPYGRQSISEDDINAVVSTLRSDYLTQGSAVPLFESSLCQYTGAAHAIAVNSATSALHISCLALGLEAGDRVWTTPITFVASANCALYCGASVDFVDIDALTLNMCPIKLAKKLKVASAQNKLPKIIIPVHFSGRSCDMKAIKKLADQYGIKVIEDASHAIGADCEGYRIGAQYFSDITVLSFHPVKIITTGEGGAALTNSSELAEKLQLLRSHGITRDTQKMGNKEKSVWYYEQQCLGFNYRMSDIHAALGLNQMKRLDEFISTRRQLAERYHCELSELFTARELTIPKCSNDKNSAWHIYVVQLGEKLKGQRDSIFNAMRSEGVGVNVHYIPVHLQPYYQEKGFKVGAFPCAEAYYKNAITLPLYPLLSVQDQDRVIRCLHDCVSRVRNYK